MPKNTRIRNRAAILMLLPIAILSWLIGWALFWTGFTNELNKPKLTAETDASITTTIGLEIEEEYST